MACHDPIADMLTKIRNALMARHESVVVFSSNEKLEYLLRVQNKVTEKFIEIVAQSMDFVENEGSLQERYDALLSYLRTLARFETGRLR